MSTGSTQTAPPAANASAPRLVPKIWLPELVYECLPYFYVLAGVISLFASLYINAWYWLLPHWILFSAFCLHGGAYILWLRHRYRSKARQQEAP